MHLYRFPEGEALWLWCAFSTNTTEQPQHDHQIEKPYIGHHTSKRCWPTMYAWNFTPNLSLLLSTKNWTTYNAYKIQYIITVLTFLLLYSNLLCILITENSLYLQHEYSLFLCQRITTLRKMVSAYKLICKCKRNVLYIRIWMVTCPML